MDCIMKDQSVKASIRLEDNHTKGASTAGNYEANYAQNMYQYAIMTLIIAYGYLFLRCQLNLAQSRYPYVIMNPQNEVSVCFV